MKKIRRYIILIVLLVIYFIAMYFLFAKDEIKQSENTMTILVGNNTIWNYSNKKWMNITSSASIKNLNWKEFTVYLDNKEYGNYLLWHDDKWYLFDKNKKAVNAEGTLIAYKANYKIKVSDFQTEPITDYTYVHQVLKDKNLSTSSLFTTAEKVSFDIDNDEIIEDFYIISNIFATEFTPDTNFSIVFMVKNDTIYYIYDDISTNDNSYKGCKPYINSFIDVDRDKENTYELILSCGRYSIQNPVDMLYKWKDDKFKILISNQ